MGPLSMSKRNGGREEESEREEEKKKKWKKKNNKKKKEEKKKGTNRQIEKGNKSRKKKEQIPKDRDLKAVATEKISFPFQDHIHEPRRVMTEHPNPKEEERKRANDDVIVFTFSWKQIFLAFLSFFHVTWNSPCLLPPKAERKQKTTEG